MSMESYLSKISYEPDIASLRADTGRRASTMEVKEYRELAGEMIWIGSAALPQAAYVGSSMQQRVPLLKESDLLSARGLLKEMRDLRPVI